MSAPRSVLSSLTLSSFAYAFFRYFAGDPDGKEGVCIPVLVALRPIERTWVSTTLIRSVFTLKQAQIPALENLKRQFLIAKYRKA